MNTLELSARELDIIRLFARMPTDVKPRLLTWLIEMGLPLALTVYGVITHQPPFLGAAIGGLVVLNAHRMFRQFKFARELQAICAKLEVHVSVAGGHNA
jgi:hypothetical protein